MGYRHIGKTGKKASLLGFSAMRLPSEKNEGEEVVNCEETIELILKGFEYGSIKILVLIVKIKKLMCALNAESVKKGAPRV